VARETMVSYHHCQKEHGNRGRHERASARKLVAPCNYVSARLHERLCFFAQLSANCFSSCPCLCLLECIFKHQLSELMFDGDRRASVLSVELERMERQFALAGEASSDELDVYQRVANSLRRLLEAVGLQRRPRNALAIDGTAEEVFSPMRSRWAAEAAAAAAKEATE
jgi:hypothetical protein